MDKLKPFGTVNALYYRCVRKKLISVRKKFIKKIFTYVLVVAMVLSIGLVFMY